MFNFAVLNVCIEHFRRRCAIGFALGAAIVLTVLAPLNVHAQIAFRSAAQASSAAGGGSIAFRAAGSAAQAASGNVAPGLPSGFATGDIHICIIESKDNVVPTMPADWTQLNSSNGGVANHQASLFWKIAAAGDTAPTITHTGGGAIVAQIIGFSGVDQTTPFDVTNSFTFNSSALTTTAAAITTVSANTMLIFTGHIADRFGSTTTPSGTWTRAFTINAFNGAGTNKASIIAYYGLRASAATQGPVSTTWSSGGGVAAPSHGALIALRPSTSGLVINVPTGTTVGDVMIASITMRPCSNSGLPCTTTVTTPTGWTLVSTTDQPSGGGTGGNGLRLYIYQKVVTGAEPASYTWAIGGTPVHAGAAGAIATFSGVDTASPIVNSAGQVTASATSHTAPAVNTGTVTNTMLVSAHAANSSSLWTPPTGMTEAADAASLTVPDGLGVSMEMNYQTNAAAGATTTRTATWTAPQPAADTGAAFMLALRPATGSTLHHLEIQSSGSGLTCAANTLTIRACQDAACSTLYTGGVSGTLTSTGTPTVNWDGTTGGAAGAGFVIASGASSVTKNMQVTPAGTVVFGISSPTPTPTSATTCNFGSPTCTFTSSLAGFIFSDTPTGNTNTIPAQVSGVASATMYLRAVQASTTTPAVCTPAIISQATAVNMRYTCNNPSTCQSGNLATITNITTAATTSITSSDTSVTLNFDANGSAPMTVRYDDVGQITLNANKTVTPFTGSTATTLTGSSNAFVVKPHHFDLTGIQQTASPNLANPAAANLAGAKFVKAGENFSVTVTAKNALNGTTQNFGKESAPESVKLTPTLVLPAGGTAGAISGTFGAFSAGVASGTTYSWNEVGIITLTPSIFDGDYLGAGDTSGTATGNVGRFYPDHFAVSGVTLSAACGGTFTYMDQTALNLAYTLQAQGVSNAVTTNYSAALAYPVGTVSLVAENANAGVDLGARIANLPAVSWASGQYVVSSASTKFSRAASPDGPFDTLAVGVKVVDADGVVITGRDMNAATTGACGVSCDAKQLGATTSVRYGRLWIQNANGSELLALPVPMETQYYVNGGFTTNTLDSCTTIAASNVGLGNFQTNLTSGATTPSVSAGTFSAGKKTITLSAPGAGKNGAADLVVNLGSSTAINNTTTCLTWTPAVTTSSFAAMPWLLGQACVTGSTSPSPTARATFGAYRKSDKFIFQRENF